MTVEARRMIGRNRLERRGALAVTDGAVVITLRRVREPQHRNHVLVLVVRKLDPELQLRRGISESKPRVITRRSLRVTHRADRRLRATEELRSMTTDASIMARIIIDIRKRDLVTRITRCFMFRRRVRELGIINLSRR